MVNYSKEQKARITENINLIINESKFRFNNIKEAWNDLERKMFYLLGFISIFVTFIIVNNLFNLLEENIPLILKLFLLVGLILIFCAGYKLVSVLLPVAFESSASATDLLNAMKKNRLVNAKFELINIYQKINDDNRSKLMHKAETFKTSAYFVLLGLLLILLAKSYNLIKFLLE